jgi:hypothetical protein
VHRDVGGRLLQRLHVGVDGEELDALDLGLDHAVDGVDAGAADADDAGARSPAWLLTRIVIHHRTLGRRSITFSGISEEKA